MSPEMRRPTARRSAASTAPAGPENLQAGRLEWASKVQWRLADVDAFLCGSRQRSSNVRSGSDPALPRRPCGFTTEVLCYSFRSSLKNEGLQGPQKADSQNPFERRQEASIVARRSRRNKIHLGVGCFDLHLGAIAPGFASVLKCDTDGRVRMSLS